jgi:peptidoglycan hydrolase-like protein with peptidoglycan-binding domain
MTTAISLHIGLNFVDANAYDGWSGPLNGCINDANSMKALAEGQGFRTTQLLNEEATSIRVIQEIVAASQVLTTGDILLISYSGHGGQVDDANSDEADAKDETWVLFDRQVIDDELYALWSRFQPGVRIMVFSDSCHSGTVIKGAFAASSDVGRRDFRARKMVTVRGDGNEEEATGTNISNSLKGATPWEDVKRAMPLEKEKIDNNRFRSMYNTLQLIAGPARSANIGASVLLISGCQDNQFSYDGDFNGQFTGTLLRVWDNGYFKGDYRSFHREIADRMPPEQSPQYTTAGAVNVLFEGQRPFTATLPVGATSTTVNTLPSSEPEMTSRKTLKHKDHGHEVRYLQERLLKKGHMVVVDGYFGRQTTVRVQEFQASVGLPADGIVGPATWAALEGTAQPVSAEPVSSFAERPHLKLWDRDSDKGGAVSRLQNLLSDLPDGGFYLSVDGVFGRQTQSIVRQFQRKHGLFADGKVGPNTWVALEGVAG